MNKQDKEELNLIFNVLLVISRDKNPNLNELLNLKNRHPGGIKFNSKKISNAAATYGNLKVLQWLKNEAKCPWGNSTLRNAAGGPPLFGENYSDDKTKEERLELVAWFYQEGASLDEGILQAAALANNTPLVKWLIEKKCPMNWECIDEAISSDCIVRAKNLEILSYMLEYFRGDDNFSNEEKFFFLGSLCHKSKMMDGDNFNYYAEKNDNEALNHLEICFGMLITSDLICENCCYIYKTNGFKELIYSLSNNKNNNNDEEMSYNSNNENE